MDCTQQDLPTIEQCSHMAGAATLLVMSDSCDPMECSPPGSSVHGILQVGILEWVAKIPSLGNLPDPEIELTSPALADRLDHIIVLFLIF